MALWLECDLNLFFHVFLFVFPFTVLSPLIPRAPLVDLISIKRTFTTQSILTRSTLIRRICTRS